MEDPPKRKVSDRIVGLTQLGDLLELLDGFVESPLEELQKLAESHGGKCLSREFRGNRAKLIWQCGNNHVWEATPLKIKKGHWCPKCLIDA